MIESLMKNFHLPTDTLRITLTPFSPRLNDQSINQLIKEIRLRIARILNWAESELFHERTTFLQDTTFPQPSSIGRASNCTYTRLRIARILNWAESEVLLARLSRFKFEAFPLIDSQH